MRIWIWHVTLMRMRILPFNLMQIRIRILPPTFSPELDHPMLQNYPLRLPPFHFDANADPDPTSPNDKDPCGSESATLTNCPTPLTLKLRTAYRWWPVKPSLRRLSTMKTYRLLKWSAQKASSVTSQLLVDITVNPLAELKNLVITNKGIYNDLPRQ